MSQAELMTIEEVAEYLRVSVKTVCDWAEKGEIPAGKFGNSWRFARADVEQWVSKRLRARGSRFDAPPVPLDNVLTIDRVRMIDAATKAEALNELIECLGEAPQVRDGDELARAVFEREALMSTGIGLGVAVPHVRLASVTDLVMAAGLSRRGIADYESLDGRPVHVIFLIAARYDQHATYIRLLSNISRRVKDDDLRERLLGAKDARDFYNALMGG